MIKLYVFFLTIFISIKGISQSSNLKNECFWKSLSDKNSAKPFKELLKLTIEAKKIKIGSQTHLIEFLYKEDMNSESSLIQFNDSIGIKVSVARAIDYKNNIYLYKIDIFERKDDCWRSKNPINYYNKFQLGTISAGYGSGIEGSIDYLFFEGTIKIE